MRVAVLSDIHANLQALEAVLLDCKKQGVDEYWLLGDYIDYGASPVETVLRLSALDAKYILSGNHDACLFNPDVKTSATPHGKMAHKYTQGIVGSNPEITEWLRSCANTPMIYLAELRTMLVHGTPFDPYWGKFVSDQESEDMFAEMRNRNVDLLLMGHSHTSFMLTKARRTIINPGSVGQPRDGFPQAAYAILEDGAVLFRRVPYDVETAANEIKKAGLPEYLWQRLYDGI